MLRRLSSFISWSDNTSSIYLANAGYIHNGVLNTVTCEHCHVVNFAHHVKLLLNKGHIFDCVFAVSSPMMLDLKHEQTRLQTFDSWPAISHVKPCDLAKDGFFYSGKSDCVKCIFCQGSLHSWTVNDIVSTEHFRWFPHCERIDNVPILNDEVVKVSVVLSQEVTAERSCKVCLDKQTDQLFLPCRHLVACIDCASKLATCPICRCKINVSIKVYFS
jgi:baculoviral IAP repeat-containing protein 7/8